MRNTKWRWMAVLALFALVLGACSSSDDGGDDSAEDTDDSTEETVELTQDGGKLAAVQDAGTLVCGVNEGVPGFGFLEEDGSYSGFDVEYCQVIAAAVLGDPAAVEYVPLAADARFTALQSGEIDVLVRNTTWTATRDGSEGAEFATTTFYDGQGMMVKADSGFGSIDDMGGTTICVLGGTTTELNLASRFGAAGLEYEPLTFDDNEVLQQSFQQGQCQGWTSDKSQLAGVRSAYPDADGGPDSLVILEETFSKEPLGPVVADGDTEWFDAVNWAVIATIQAEEFGIDSTNIDTFLESEDPEIRRFLGVGGGEDDAIFDPGLGLEVDFAQTVIREVGNYAEIYDRNVGPDTALGLDRGVNALWTDGGLLYPPPYR
jgi:general L-amino acid transport system substrate-binding protein